jgi:hypothetical protein
MVALTSVVILVVIILYLSAEPVVKTPVVQAPVVKTQTQVQVPTININFIYFVYNFSTVAVHIMTKFYLIIALFTVGYTSIPAFFV